jgi:hypothetical protein
MARPAAATCVGAGALCGGVVLDCVGVDEEAVQELRAARGLAFDFVGLLQHYKVEMLKPTMIR